MSTALGYTFDATQVAPNTRPPALPDDWYVVMISGAEIKPTKAGDGHLAEFTLKVYDGPAAGRLLFARLNLWNPSKQATDIAQGELSAICHATEVMQVSDLSAFFGKYCMVRAVYKPAGGGYDEGNEVKGWAKYGEKQSINSTGVLAPFTHKPPAGPPSAPVANGTTPTGAPGTFSPPWGAQPGTPTPAPAAPPPTPAGPPAPPAPAPGPAAPPPPPAPAGPPAPPPGPARVGSPAPSSAAPANPPWVR